MAIDTIETPVSSGTTDMPNAVQPSGDLQDIRHNDAGQSVGYDPVQNVWVDTSTRKPYVAPSTTPSATPVPTSLPALPRQDLAPEDIVHDDKGHSLAWDKTQNSWVDPITRKPYVSSAPLKPPTESLWTAVPKTVYHEVGDVAQGGLDMLNHVVGYAPSENARTEMARAWSAIKSGNVSEATNHFRAATADVVTNHPAAQMVEQQWNSSAANLQKAQEAAKKGDLVGVTHHMAGVPPMMNVAKDAIDKAVKEPTLQNWIHAGTMLLSAGAAGYELASGLGGAEPLAAETATAEAVAPEAAAEAAEPGVIKQVLKGEKVAQPGAQAALRNVAQQATPVEEATPLIEDKYPVKPGVAKPTTQAAPAPELRESLTAPIEAADKGADALYKTIDDATGTDIKGLSKKLRDTNFKIRMSTNPTDEAAWELKRTNIQDTIADALKQAKDAGVPDDQLSQADAQFKKMSALTDVEKKVFNNVNVIDPTTGEVRLDAAVKELQKLQDNTKYGSPRLEQAFGKGNTILEDMKAANRLGIKALNRQQLAKMLLKYGVPGAAAVGGLGWELMK
jgi:hypothetical protein